MKATYQPNALFDLSFADEAGCKMHAAMGFEGGWGAALDQLVAMVKKGIRT